MLKFTFTLFAILAMFSIGIVFTSSYSEPETSKNIICDGDTISTGTFNSIIVSGGSTCIIENVVVLKNIQVLSTQFTRISDSLVKGNVVITNSLGAGSVVLYNSTIGGNVKMIQSDFTSLWIDGSTIDRDLILKDQIIGESEIQNSQIGQNLRITDNIVRGHIEFESSSVLGNTIVSNNVGNDPIVLENNLFGQDVRVIGNNIDDNIEVTVNTIQGNLAIRNNQGGGIEIGENMIEKNLQVINNQLFADMGIYKNEVNQQINTSNNNIGQFFINYNTSNVKMVLKNNVIEHRFDCGDNSPEPTMIGNTFAGQPIDECIKVEN